MKARFVYGPDGLTERSPLAVAFFCWRVPEGPPPTVENVISGRPSDISDLTEPSEAEPLQIDGAHQVPHAGPVQ